MNREPARIIGLITAAVEALIAVAVAFGLDLTPDQVAAVMGFVGAVGVLAAALLIRRQVTPVADPRLTPEQADRVFTATHELDHYKV